jgi:hypothetical protein
MMIERMILVAKKRRFKQTLNSRQKIVKMMNNHQDFQDFLGQHFNIDEDTKKGWEIIDQLKSGVNEEDEAKLLEEYKKLSKSRWSH